MQIKCNYPEVEDFFSKLAEENLQRELHNLGKQLTKAYFFCINEIKDEDEKFYQQCPYNLEPGDAKFARKSVKEAVHTARQCFRGQSKWAHTLLQFLSTNISWFRWCSSLQSIRHEIHFMKVWVSGSQTLIVVQGVTRGCSCVQIPCTA